MRNKFIKISFLITSFIYLNIAQAITWRCANANDFEEHATSPIVEGDTTYIINEKPYKEPRVKDGRDFYTFMITFSSPITLGSYLQDVFLMKNHSHGGYEEFSAKDVQTKLQYYVRGVVADVPLKTDIPTKTPDPLAMFSLNKMYFKLVDIKKSRDQFPQWEFILRAKDNAPELVVDPNTRYHNHFYCVTQDIAYVRNMFFNRNNDDIFTRQITDTLQHGSGKFTFSYVYFD